MTSIKHIENISNHFIELEKRVGKVRFARIEASKRLKTKGVIYNTIISFYSILITVLAIVFSTVNLEEINDKETHELIGTFFKYQTDSVIILALSSFITMLTLFFANRTYSERAARYQSNYMELTRLLADIQNLMVYYHLQDYEEFKKFKPIWNEQYPTKNLEKRLAKKYKVFADKYAALLTQSENHEDIDYTKACLDEVDDKIASLEKKHIEACCLKNEEVSVQWNAGSCCLLGQKGRFEHNPCPIELRKMYLKKAELEQIIAGARWIDNFKYLFIGILPIVLLVIIKLFQVFLGSV